MPCPTLVRRLVRANARQVIGAGVPVSVSVSWFGNGYLPKPAGSAGACVYLRIDEQEAGRNQSSVGCEVQSIQSFPFALARHHRSRGIWEWTMLPFPARAQQHPVQAAPRGARAYVPWSLGPWYIVGEEPLGGATSLPWVRGSPPGLVVARRRSFMARPRQSLKSTLIALSTPGDPNHSLFFPRPLSR
ncbi:hypothetical protein BDP55DRAFT_625368 [Colletotrichum godetiae]|uniref:Uncharacterized protein n=1 Tax=Colletotrichum godetiae TaxID=1209918 RepID=A0AAJ0AZE9_9PEZI|nr:uncharacterized protein BDP55DRAFT_625368 [Colletotrichum godetiae]KAK1701119.1 hypothetical protein BDP55DRAFT_625368 [Colletotrichum godetiae]